MVARAWRTTYVRTCVIFFLGWENFYVNYLEGSVDQVTLITSQQEKVGSSAGGEEIFLQYLDQCFKVNVCKLVTSCAITAIFLF